MDKQIDFVPFAYCQGNKLKYEKFEINFKTKNKRKAQTRKIEKPNLFIEIDKIKILLMGKNRNRNIYVTINVRIK